MVTALQRPEVRLERSEALAVEQVCARTPGSGRGWRERKVACSKEYAWWGVRQSFCTQQTERQYNDNKRYVMARGSIVRACGRDNGGEMPPEAGG